MPNKRLSSVVESAWNAVGGTVVAATYGLVWLPVAVMAVTIKRKILNDEGGGYDFLASTMGLADGTQLGLLQRLALYRWDIIIALILVPLVWMWLMRVVGPRTRFLLSAVCSIIATVILFVELKTYWEVGTFLPAEVLAAGVFGAGRAYAADYLATTSVAKLGALVGASFLIALVAFLAERHLRQRAANYIKPLTLALAMVALLLAAAPPYVPSTPFSRSGISIGMLAFAGAGNDAPEASDLSEAPEAKLIGAYREVSGAPVPNKESSFFGAAEGFNVLFYLYETLPKACSSAPAAEELLPNLHALEGRGFVTEAHYATYPYSRRAYFSIYSGWYPAHGMRGYLDLWDDEADPLAPGVVASARASGYLTQAFVPEVASEWEDDVRRYRSLGFEQHLVPPNAELVLAPREPQERVAWQRQRDNDSRAMLIESIRKSATSDRPWLATFNPQLTHGPWPGASSASNEEEICARGLPLFAEVDKGLGEVLKVLAETGQASRTIVVVLGDHGLRTSAEYPGFRGATLDDITFHVPLVIYVPGLLNESFDISWPTSHVDIAPSVLDLLGIKLGREAEQGSPMWNPALRDRRIFVYAQGYLGADGFVDKQRAVMLNYFLGGVAQTQWKGRLRFSPAELLERADGEDQSQEDSLAAILHRSVAIQRVYMTRMSMSPDDSLVKTPRVSTGELIEPVKTPR